MAEDNPGMTVRELAAKAGVAVGTAHIAKAGVQDRTPDRVTGKDGKSYPAKRKAKPKPNYEMPTVAEAEEDYQAFVASDLAGAKLKLACQSVVARAKASRRSRSPIAQIRTMVRVSVAGVEPRFDSGALARPPRSRRPRRAGGQRRGRKNLRTEG
jgi:hypothetical protein